ncbi:MAG: metalloregulator ArsR/SmtB family transcription factor, partial [Candidatus Moraniibacteriota bacterium]
EESLCVCKIFKALKISQKLTSHHLGQLKKAGILDRRKEGIFVYYSLNKKIIKEKSKLLNNLIK